MSKINILIVCEAVFPESKGGLERWLTTLSEELTKKNLNITYFNRQNINLNRNGVQYISPFNFAWSYKSGGKRSIFQAIAFALGTFKHLRNSNYDVIYCSSVPVLPIILIAFNNLWSKKVLIVEWFEVWSLKYWVSYIGYTRGIVGWLVQLLAQQLGDARITYNNNAFNYLYKKSFLGNSSNIIKLKGLYTNLNTHKNKKHNLNRNDIIFLGRFTSEKQPILAIDIISELVNIGWVGHFWMIGTGPLKLEIEAKTKRINLENRVTILNNVSDQMVEKKMLSSFALLHPSKREGYGLAILEAAGRGVPAIMIRYPENRAIELEILPELVSESENPKDMVDLLLHAHKYQEQIRKKLKKSINKNSNISNINESITNIEKIILNLYKPIDYL
jgi:glycosyltransferase involved in cell wall biosynthesis